MADERFRNADAAGRAASGDILIANVPPLEYAAEKLPPRLRLLTALAWNAFGYEIGLIIAIAFWLSFKLFEARWPLILLTMVALTLVNAAGFALAVVLIRGRTELGRQLFYALTVIAGFVCGLGINKYPIAYSRFVRPLLPVLDNQTCFFVGLAFLSFSVGALLLLIGVAIGRPAGRARYVNGAEL